MISELLLGVSLAVSALVAAATVRNFRAKRGAESSRISPNNRLVRCDLSALPNLEEPRDFPARVLITSEARAVINRGSDDGIEKGARFVVYSIAGDEVRDPESGESLGLLEIVRGRGIATHVEGLATTLDVREGTASVGDSAKRI